MNTTKIRFFISPNNILVSEDEVDNNKIKYFAIVENKIAPTISVFKKRYINDTSVKYSLFTVDYNSISSVKNSVLYQTLNIEHNTSYYGQNHLFNAWTVQGILERYISSQKHSPHLSIFKHGNLVLCKTSFPTIFRDCIYPNVINSNFEDIIHDYLPEQYALFLSHKQKELSYLETPI